MISSLPISTIKLHQLQIIKGTALAKDFEAKSGNYPIFSLDEYIDFVISFTERLKPEIMIERFTAEVPPRFLLLTGGLEYIKTKSDTATDQKRKWRKGIHGRG